METNVVLLLSFGAIVSWIKELKKKKSYLVFAYDNIAFIIQFSYNLWNVRMYGCQCVSVDGQWRFFQAKWTMSCDMILLPFAGFCIVVPDDKLTIRSR